LEKYNRKIVCAYKTVLTEADCKLGKLKLKHFWFTLKVVLAQPKQYGEYGNYELILLALIILLPCKAVITQ
jgi:hypothetical protein